MTSEIATHDPPPQADFLIQADLTPHGMPGRREQLWTRQTGPKTFVLRSLPFFVYGVALDDEVETDDNFSLTRVVRPSGHRVLRVAAQPDSAQDVHDELHRLLEQLGLEHEWHRIGYAAIDVRPGADPRELVDFLDERAEQGDVAYEFA